MSIHYIALYGAIVTPILAFLMLKRSRWPVAAKIATVISLLIIIVITAYFIVQFWKAFYHAA